MAELQLDSFSVVNPVLCPEKQYLFDKRPYPTKSKGSGVRIKMADDCGQLMQWGKENGELTQE